MNKLQAIPNIVPVHKTRFLVPFVALILLLPVVGVFPHRAFGETIHAPILINGNDQFTSDNGVVAGSGTSDDPYIISGWTISSGDYGIEIRNTDAYFTITDVTIIGAYSGIGFISLSNGLVQNSHITVNGQGILVDSSDSFQLADNNLHAGGRVISLRMDSSFDISNNVLYGGTHVIFGSNVSDASIVGNTGGAESGIRLDSFSGVLVSQNTITGHTPVDVSNCGDVTIDSNTASASSYGIFVSRCTNVSVTNNNATSVSGSHSDAGIWLSESDNIDVSSNSLSNNSNGILLTNGSTGNSVTGNTITHNNCGITTDLTTVDQNYIADNTFVGNTQDFCNS